MNKYRISKYNPQYRDVNGAFIKDEWTSYSDIGKIYNSEAFTLEQYLDIEEAYCSTIMSILHYCNIEEMIVDKLEKNYSIREIENFLKSKGIKITYLEKKIISLLKNGIHIQVEDLNTYIKLFLRECFWCNLNSNNSSVRLEFGYDLYVYIYCDYIETKMIDECKAKGIYIEKISM